VSKLIRSSVTLSTARVAHLSRVTCPACITRHRRATSTPPSLQSTTFVLGHNRALCYTDCSAAPLETLRPPLGVWYRRWYRHSGDPIPSTQPPKGSSVLVLTSQGSAASGKRPRGRLGQDRRRVTSAIPPLSTNTSRLVTTSACRARTECRTEYRPASTGWTHRSRRFLFEPRK
jgi:hypothetical protein